MDPPMSRFDTEQIRRYYDRNTSSFVALGQGGSVGAIHRAVWGPGTTTREQAERFFARESAVNAAARLRYSNREHAKFMIDNLIEDGYTLAAGMRGCVKTVCLVGPAGQNIELRRKAEIDYVRVVTNTGNMARNY